MNEAITWRSYFHELVRRKSAAEKKQLYAAVGVSRAAFQRWRNGENTPDAAHLTLLLKALAPEEGERLQSLMLDDPKVRALLPREEVLQGGQAPDRIPQEVYEEVLRLGRDLPDRFWLLCSTILFRTLSQLETHPTPSGVEISVARCMPPSQNGKVRSLRDYVGRGTPPWRADLHTRDEFLGAQSLAGAAVMQRHGIMVPDRNEASLLTPEPWREQEQSGAAYPILREGRIAGALVVASCVPAFFTQDKLTLIERYADLIGLAFSDHAFYPAASIELGLMPPRQVQQASLRSFPQRVMETYRRAMREDQPMQELVQIEARVRAELEEELLQLAS